MTAIVTPDTVVRPASIDDLPYLDNRGCGRTTTYTRGPRGRLWKLRPVCVRTRTPTD